jgi:ribonucleoside-diphosphate reductase alpha chain
VSPVVRSMSLSAAALSDPVALGFPAHWPAVALDIWDKKYRFKAADGSPVDQSWADTVARVATAAAKIEPGPQRKKWQTAFADVIGDFTFLPAGRILAGAGTKRRVTLFNCFVMGRIDDDLTAIFEQVKQAALTMQQGGGIGHDFSTLRPKGAVVKSIGADASGPVTFMDVWDAMCRTIMSAGARRGAMMATLRCDHPDIEAFIAAKREAGRLRNFNLSVLVTDAFIRAVEAGAAWDLVFDGTVYRTVEARALWDAIMRATYEVAEPGVIFIDRVNALNTLSYCEEIHATNPCGEQPLPPYGACLLGSINLAQLVEGAFTPQARFNLTRLEAVTATAIRFLDNIVDVSAYPLPEQRAEAKAKRRLGLGVTGLANALAMLGVRYGSPEAITLVDRWLATLKAAAYRASAALADEKGAFPLCDPAALLARPALAHLPDDIRVSIAKTGLRNGLLTSVAPTGTISLLAGNVSSGIEPVFDHAYERRILQPDGTARTERVEDFAHAAFRRHAGQAPALPTAFVTAHSLAPADHLAMQAVAQRHVDSAISKTINCPVDLPFDAFKDIYLDAYRLGLKGVTTYRPNAVTGSVLLSPSADASAQPVLTAAVPSVAARPQPVLVSDDPGVVYMTEPLTREPVLGGFTYKLRWPASDHAMYITINDIEQNGRQRPFEIFINSKNLEHYAWTLALTRMISAVFRRGGDVSFVVEELKAVFDPQGGRWVDGRYVPSLLAAIGEVIETHLTRIGFLPEQTGGALVVAPVSRAAVGEPRAASSLQTKTAVSKTTLSKTVTPQTVAAPASMQTGPSQASTARLCPRCSAASYVRREACWICETCGHSSCG